MAAQQVHPGTLELVERPGFGCREQSEGRVEAPGLNAGLGRSQRALCAPRRVDRQGDGALQERSRGGEPTTSLRAVSRTLELGSDFLIRPRCGSSAVPGAPVRVGLGVGGFGEGRCTR